MEKSKKETGKVDVTIVSKELGQMWKDLNSKKRKPYMTREKIIFFSLIIIKMQII